MTIMTKLASWETLEPKFRLLTEIDFHRKKISKLVNRKTYALALTLNCICLRATINE